MADFVDGGDGGASKPPNRKSRSRRKPRPAASGPAGGDPPDRDDGDDASDALAELTLGGVPPAPLSDGASLAATDARIAALVAGDVRIGWPAVKPACAANDEGWFLAGNKTVLRQALPRATRVALLARPLAASAHDRYASRPRDGRSSPLCDAPSPPPDDARCRRPVRNRGFKLSTLPREARARARQLHRQVDALHRRARAADRARADVRPVGQRLPRGAVSR